MTDVNFMLQDVIGVITGCLLLSLIFIPPGYVAGHTFDLFNFRSRKGFTKLGVALLLSTAITPGFFFLAYRLVSESFAILIIFTFVIIFLFQFISGNGFFSIIRQTRAENYIKTVLWIIGIWILVAIISLIDIQVDHRLYFNITAFDYQTRVSVIDAITRTGVPPANPSFYPGEPFKLTFLYYFWYVLCSLIDKLGGNIVSARTALISSVIWIGLSIMGTIAFYLRIRNSNRNVNHWKNAIIGIALLAVSGLDIFGSTFYMIFPQYLYGYFIDGDIEHWNEQITAWAGTTMWTPHHLASLLACFIGWMLVFYHENEKAPKNILAASLAGLAFASAFGLSSWVTLIFVLFWLYWIISRLLRGEKTTKIWVLFWPGVIAGFSILPFLLDLVSGNNGGAGSIQALSFDIRWFRPALYFIINTPTWAASTVNLLLLPLNYFLELGFFFVVGILWLSLIRRKRLERIKYWKEEIVLLGISVFVTSFTRSTLIANNDFGWRGWLPGQFILLIWGTDIVTHFWKNRPVNLKLLVANPKKVNRIRYSLIILLTLGFLTTLQDLILLRIWPVLIDTHVLSLPKEFQSDEYIGTKNFEARTLFSAIDKLYPKSVIVQFNPAVGLNRATGLYRTRGSVFSFHSLYGVPENEFRPLGSSIQKIFNKKFLTLEKLDETCEQYKIDILIIADKDELWNSVASLTELRQPFFSGNHYAVFECGK